MSNEAARHAFVERLRVKRIELGLRQRDVGRLLGVHNMTVSRWETNKRTPSLDVARQWAELLGVRVVGGSLAEMFQAARARCGTTRGYKQHQRRGERCPSCWAYNAAAYTRRPRPVVLHRVAVAEMFGRGMSAAAIARELGVAGSTARQWVARMRAQASSTGVGG